MAVVKSIQELDKLQSMEAAQNAKIKWAIEGDENFKYYHRILNKKRHQLSDLEIDVSNDEIKRAVCDCGVDKSLGPHGFTFEFYRHFWKLIENDVVAAMKYFFQIGSILKGYNSSFIALILKIPDAKMVKDFRPISLIGSLYKIIAMILANRLVVVLGDIRSFLSIHISFQRVVDAGLFNGIVLDSSMQLSRMFYSNDAVFVGQWSDSNIDTIIHVLECFHRALCLRINISKSRLMGIAMDVDRVEQAALKIRCAILKAPFSYLGSKVRGLISGIQSWKEIVNNMVTRLSKWKMKTLLIGERLTLLKSVLGSIPIYHMSIYKVPMKIWRFTTHKSSLWARVIKAIHGDDGKIGKNSKSGHTSIWRDIVQEMEVFKKQEQSQLADLLTTIEGVSLVSMSDRWVWFLEGSGNFSVASVRKLIDDRSLPDVSSKTRWIKAVPIK
nr:RNA-directed DNA polymerase, eukaryota, reverse transcriptase zinc-binding domain protein [Tanacetum cinerariifolium]